MVPTGVDADADAGDAGSGATVARPTR